MAGEAYEILALLMRYVFVLIGALVLLRAYRWMRRDARNYRREMRTLPDAGLVGEIVDLRTGKSQPLPREGDMGASRECDIHVRGAGVLRHHVRFAFEEGKGVMITPSRLGKTFLGGAQLRAPGYALHGTQLQLGDALLRVRFDSPYGYEQVLTLMLARFQRTGGAVLVTARLTTRIADMALRMQRYGVATRLVWVSDDERDESMTLIERLKMGGVQAERLDPWDEGN